MRRKKYKGRYEKRTLTKCQEVVRTYDEIQYSYADVLLMGCNTFDHLAAGFVDIQRTGEDTSGLDFDRTKKDGVNTLAFRMAQRKTFFFVDADCVGITNTISWDKNKQWLDVLAKSGTPLFMSIADDVDFDNISIDIVDALKKASENDVVSKPID